MTRTKILRRLVVLPLSLLIMAHLAGGCSDVMTSPEEPVLGDEASKGGADGQSLAQIMKKITKMKKARYFHMLPKAMKKGDGGTAGKAEEADSARLVIGFNGSATADSVLEAVLTKYKVFSRFEYKTAVRGKAVTVAKTELLAFSTELNENEHVDAFEPDPEIPVDSSLSEMSAASAQQIPWSITDVAGETSWAQSGDGTGAVGVDIYILDTGVNHPDLNVVECLQFTKRLGAAPCADPGDQGGHGTEVAGIAAAIDDVTGIVGVAPGARVHAYKALNAKGKMILSAFIKVVDYVTEQKLANPGRPMVVNMSLGADVKSGRLNRLDEAVRASIAAGVVYVIAAGNDQIDASKVTPAHVPEAITVGAYDESGTLASFSNYGSVIDILAPGANVLTLSTEGGLKRSSGTSLSAPHVTGAVALLLAQNPSLTPAQVREQLLAKSRPNITGVPLGTTNRSLYVGE